MATTTATKSTTPRAARGTARPKAAPKTTAPTDVEVPATESAAKADRFVVDLEYERDTKRFAKFNVPASLEGTMAGSIYAPLGTDTVKVAIMGVDSAPNEE